MALQQLSILFGQYDSMEQFPVDIWTASLHSSFKIGFTTDTLFLSYSEITSVSNLQVANIVSCLCDMTSYAMCCGIIVTTCSELLKVLFLALCVTFFCVYEISREPLNRLAPTS